MIELLLPVQEYFVVHERIDPEGQITRHKKLYSGM
jgi:hypothetical protein